MATPSSKKYPKNNNTTSSVNNKPRLTSMLGSFLETAIHELLYLRSLYPHDAFSPSRHLQIAVHACRHPAVVDYIYDTLKVAVPSIISGEVDALYLIFWDESTGALYERYSFEFDSSFMRDDEYNNVISGASSVFNNMNTDIGIVIQELERSLRDVLLSIMSLDGSDLGRRRGVKNFTDTTTFKICLHTKKKSEENNNRDIASTTSATMHSYLFDTNNDDTFGPDLKEAIESGKWRRSDSKSCHLHPDVENDRITHHDTDLCDRNDKQRMFNNCNSRPLKSFNAPLCGLKMQLVMDLEN